MSLLGALESAWTALYVSAFALVYCCRYSKKIEYFRSEQVGRRVREHEFALHHGAHFDHQVARGIGGDVRHPPPEWVVVRVY